LAKGRTVDDIVGNEADQRRIDDMQLRTEHGLRAIDVAFLDRAFPDSLTMRRAVGLNPNTILADCFHYRYASVCILDRLPLQKDGLRIEDDAFAEFVDEWFTRDYTALGYGIVRVPVLSIDERLAFIFDRLPEQGLWT
jgi:predicted ATPase